MRQLLATIILGGALAVTASTAFAAAGDHGSVTTPAFSPVTLDSSTDSVSMSGTDSQQIFPDKYRSDNIEN